MKKVNGFVLSKLSFELIIILEGKQDIWIRSDLRLEIIRAVVKILKILGRKDIECYFMDNLNMDEFVSDADGFV